MTAKLSDLNKGFRETYLDFSALSAQVHAWAEAFPDVVRLSSIGKTQEGRDLWLLTIGPEPDRARPAAWVDGNMHASELCGSSVALAIAEDMIGLHLGTVPVDLPAPVVDRLRDVLFYVLPRMSPDGAEAVLTTGRYVRSNLRDERPNQNQARWQGKDMDGDGLALLMRKEDPCGEYVAHADTPGFLLPRRVEDEGPYYRLYPEGEIENFDGKNIPSPGFMEDLPNDLNRNFPWSWAPAHQQVGAGSFPTSEPESRAVVEFSSRAPHIFSWLNLHTFGGVFIRPLGNKPDSKMDQEDLSVFRQIEEWGDKYTGYPTVSGFEEFTYEPDTPLCGDLSDYAYHQRGAIAYVCELWDLFARIGKKRPKRFVDYYSQLTIDDMKQIARWDAKENKGRVVRPWVAVDHPQLGAVEVGGLDPRVGMWNPPYELVAEACQNQSAAYLRVAAMAPHLVCRSQTQPLGDDRTRVDVTVENQGYLPTYVLSSAKKLDWNEPLYAAADSQGCQLEDANLQHREVGHLDGWGRGRFSDEQMIFYSRSRGNQSQRKLTYIVKGKGSLRVKIGSCRTGLVEHVVEV